MKLNLFLSAVFSIVLFQSCSSGSGSGSSSDPSTSTPTLSSADFMGSWQSTCGPTVDSVDTVTFNSNNTIEFKSLSGSSNGVCTDVMQVRFLGTTAFGSASTVVANALDINMTIGSIFIKPTTSGAAANLNAGNFCGHNDWADGVEKDVSPGCPGLLSVGTTIYSVSGITSGVLKMGAAASGSSHDGSSVALRHDSLDSKEFHKIP